MLGINLNQAQFSLIKENERNNTQSQPQLRLQTLNKDTVSFKAKTNADVYLSELGKLVKNVTNSVREDAEGSIQMVALEDVPRVIAEHKRLLEDPNVKPVVKQLIRHMEPKLAKGGGRVWRDGHWVEQPSNF